MLNADLIRQYNKTRTTLNDKILCHAPFVSLNFEQNGNVTACCLNRSHVLGTYPKHSIQKIWGSAKTKELRRYMKKNDLGGGCKSCKQNIKAQNFYGTHARDFDQFAGARKLFKKKVMPRVMEFELSNRCNLECVMCSGYFSSSIRKNREKLPPIKDVYDAGFVEQLKPFLPYLSDAKFLGGEPFLINIYYEIWEAIAQINPEILLHITTNATVLNQRAKQLLERMRCGIILSIDAVEKTLYEQIRQNANFDRVMENIDYFVDYTRRKNTWLSLAVCPITLNWQNIPEIVLFASQRNASIYFNTVNFPRDLAINHMPVEQLQEVLDYYRNFSFPAAIQMEPVFQKNYRVFQSLIDQVEHWTKERPEEESYEETALVWQERIEQEQANVWIGKALLKDLLSSPDTTDPEELLFMDLIQIHNSANFGKIPTNTHFVIEGYKAILTLKGQEPLVLDFESENDFIELYYAALKRFHQLIFETEDPRLDQNMDTSIRLFNTDLRSPESIRLMVTGYPMETLKFLKEKKEEDIRGAMLRIKQHAP